MNRSLRRAIWPAAALASILGPLLGAAAVAWLAPAALVDAAGRASGAYLTRFDRGLPAWQRGLAAAERPTAWPVYLGRVWQGLTRRTATHIASAALWAACYALAALALRRVAAAWFNGPYGWLWETTSYLVLAMAIATAARWPALSALVAAAIYFANGVLPRLLLSDSAAGPTWPEVALVVVLASLLGLAHSLAPTVLLMFVAWCFRPGSARAVHRAMQAGRAIALLVALPAGCLAAALWQPPERTRAVYHVLRTGDLDQLLLDAPRGRLLATRRKDKSCLIMGLQRFELDDWFVLPAEELGELALDDQRREIYHLERSTGELVVLDADNFRIRRDRVVGPAGAAGTTRLAYNRSADQLAISLGESVQWIDAVTLRPTGVAMPGPAYPLANPEKGIFYLHGLRDGSVSALTLEPNGAMLTVPGPGRGEPMALSPTRQELYVADAEAGRISVYALPSLAFVRAIDVDFGSRFLAVDDARGVLVVASVASGRVAVHSPVNGRLLAAHYVGPAIRSLVLDTRNRRALVTLPAEGLFGVKY